MAMFTSGFFSASHLDHCINGGKVLGPPIHCLLVLFWTGQLARSLEIVARSATSGVGDEAHRRPLSEVGAAQVVTCHVRNGVRPLLTEFLLHKS